jgi:hypothetical protein
MDLRELFDEFRDPDLWPTAFTEVTSSADASVLEISCPLPCTARTVAWRRTALMLLAGTGVGAHDLPDLFFDRVNEWNLTRIVVVTDEDYTPQAQALFPDSSKVVLISRIEAGDPAQEGSHIRALRIMIPRILLPAHSDQEVAQTLDRICAQADEPADVPRDMDLLTDLLNALQATLTFIDACLAPPADLGLPVKTRLTLQSGSFSRVEMPDGSRQIYCEIETLTPNVDLYRQVLPLRAHPDRADGFWAAVLPLCRDLALLRMTFRDGASLAGSIQRITDGLPSLRHPGMMRMMASLLAANPGANTTQALHGLIRRLRLDGPELVDELAGIATSAPRQLALLAIETLGELRAARVRDMLAALAASPYKGVRDAAARAIERIDDDDPPPATDDSRAPEPPDVTMPIGPPGERYFYGPKGTTLTVTPAWGDWADSERTVLTTHPDGTRDILTGGADTKRFVEAVLLGLAEMPQEHMAAMGESVLFDPATGKHEKIPFRAADDQPTTDES